METMRLDQVVQIGHRPRKTEAGIHRSSPQRIGGHCREDLGCRCQDGQGSGTWCYTRSTKNEEQSAGTQREAQEIPLERASTGLHTGEKVFRGEY
jgi:hypothetical protein